MQKNPLTHCDPANANGVAYAAVSGGVSGFTFDWFPGTVSATPIYTGAEAKGLGAATYVVTATDALTGCEGTASILIESNPVNVPEPTVTVVSHHTNCITPDGILSASVDGNTSSYALKWYNGGNVTNQADETGEFYRGLAAGFYTTTARDNESGCISEPVITEILPFQERPEFDIGTVPTNCEQDVGEASVEILNDVQVASIEWDINGSHQVGGRISQLPKGEFTVTITTFQQCAESKTFVIEPHVLVFNGISRNNDGQNEIFEIACIQDFPNNNVKIFNRAGTLVYEADSYDNEDVFFGGVSNRGLSLLGTDLPDGTYFYIIDKRNGSKPQTGYLELLR
jgi:large repetitive protein